MTPSSAQERAELARVEAALFISREPLTARKIAQLADLDDAARAKTLVKKLNERQRKLGAAFAVVEIAGGYELRTAPEFAPWIFRLAEPPREPRLTNSAMETLAIVAYEQPVLRANVERIRGARCADVLRQLLEQDLIRIVGRSDELGRPFLYGTTKRFLKLFGLARIEDLPQREYDWATAQEAKEIVEEIVEVDDERARERANLPPKN